MAIRQRNTTKQKPGRLVIYARISDEREGRQNGVKRQEQQCRRIAEQDGDEVVRVFVDDDRSAYSGKIRPDYANMIKYLEAGHADGVLALAPTRLYRKLYEPKTRQDYLHFHDLVNRLDLHVQTVKAGRFEPPPRPADAEGRTGSLRKTLSGTGPSDSRGRWSSPPGWSGSTTSPARNPGSLGYASTSSPTAQATTAFGYDFLVHDGDRTLLYEVKASTKDRREFELGESEVERASHLHPDEVHTIVYVSHVLDRTHRRITPLPNPFSAPGLAGYRLVGTAMRLRFELPPGEPEPSP